MNVTQWNGFRVTLPSGHVEFIGHDELKALAESVNPFIASSHGPIIAAIFRAVGEAFDVSEAQLRTPRKPEWIAIPRMAAMALLDRHAEMNLTKIVRFMGMKSHGTASNAIGRMNGGGKDLKPKHAHQWQRAEKLAEKYVKEAA